MCQNYKFIHYSVILDLEVAASPLSMHTGWLIVGIVLECFCEIALTNISVCAYYKAAASSLKNKSFSPPYIAGKLFLWC